VHPLFDPNTYTATMYLVVCAMYLRDRHDRWSRCVLTAAALLLALCALMKVEGMQVYVSTLGLNRLFW
jgi:hypothetical protein